MAKAPFIKCPRALIESYEDVSSSAKILYLLLRGSVFWQKESEDVQLQLMSPGHAKLAKTLACSTKTIVNLFAELKQHELISIANKNRRIGEVSIIKLHL